MSQVSPAGAGAGAAAPAAAATAASDDEPEIDVISSSDSESEPIYIPREKEPVVIRGVGNITVFGMNSRFNTDYPPELTGYIAPEELSATLSRVNAVLKRHVQTSSRWLLCGLAFCCCSLGCSMWPVLCLNRRTVLALEKCLDHENVSLYHKLGLHWTLARRPTEPSDRLTEYVLELKILPKAALNIPD
uniref:Erf4 domain-containing protein n=1 Tax=Caenorhabditis japonica TaxID=281687 RepID=A0A8R1E362_CAEJA